MTSKPFALIVIKRYILTHLRNLPATVDEVYYQFSVPVEVAERRLHNKSSILRASHWVMRTSRQF